MWSLTTRPRGGAITPGSSIASPADTSPYHHYSGPPRLSQGHGDVLVVYKCLLLRRVITGVRFVYGIEVSADNESLLVELIKHEI
jgi:hypothetical protein